MWREKVVKEMFALHLAPLLKTLAAIAPLSMSILWENIMIRIVPLYTPEVDNAEQESQHIQADFSYLTQGAPGHLFGVKKSVHPVHKNKDSIPAVKSKRTTCCFYYRMSGEYCRKCPKIDNENNSQLK